MADILSNIFFPSMQLLRDIEYCLAKIVYMQITKWHLIYENMEKCHSVREPVLVHAHNLHGSTLVFTIYILKRTKQKTINYPLCVY